jgi:hypothetical protein
MASSDPYDVPGGAPVPDPYASGARAIYEYQASHRGPSFDALWTDVGDDAILVHQGITFLPDRSGYRYVPETRESSRSGCLALLGGVIAVAFVVVQLLPDGCTSTLTGLGFGAWIGVGAVFLGLVVFALARGTRETKSKDERGIWIEGVFLFPDALVRRTKISVEVVPKKDIVRFVYRKVPSHARHETCVVRRDGNGEESFLYLWEHRDSTKPLDDWLRAPS